MRLGKEQRKRLVALGSPGMAQVVGCKVTRSLVKRGLLRSYEDDSFACITPSGLRVLANEMEAGRVEGAMEWSERERAKHSNKGK